MMAKKIFNWPGVGWQHPLIQLEKMQRDMAQLTGALFGSPDSRVVSSNVFPAVNILEDQDKFYLRAELPGIKNDDIDLQIAGRNITISGERKSEMRGDEVTYHRREREAGKFSRVIGLPSEIDSEKVQAKLADGMLTVTIPKADTVKAKRISIS